MTKPSTLLLPEATRLLVEAPLSWGAIVDPQGQRGKTPLHLACQEGHLACALALLKAGASASMSIHYAAQYNRVEIVRALLDYGCSPNMVSCCDNAFTTLMTPPFSWTVRQGTHHSRVQHWELSKSFWNAHRQTRNS